MSKKGWREPKNKTEWLADLVDASEAVVIGYEMYLMDKIGHKEMAGLMTNLRHLIPMDLEDKIQD
jgi:hypothetical protein